MHPPTYHYTYAHIQQPQQQPQQPPQQQHHYPNLLHPATHTPPFNIHHIQPIPQITQMGDRIMLNKLRRIDLKYKEEQQKQNWIEKHNSKMKNIQQHIDNRNKKANRVREQNIISNAQRQAERQKYNEQKTQELLNRHQFSQQKIHQCRTRANLKKNQYIFRIQNKTSEKLGMVDRRRKMADDQQEQQSRRVHLQEWNNYRSGLIKKHSGKQLRNPKHLYQQYKAKKDKLKNMLYQMCDSHQPPSQQHQLAKTHQSINNTPIPKFHPNKIAYFGIHSQNQLQNTPKDLQKMRVFLEECGGDGSESLADRFKNFMIQSIL